MNSTFGLSTLRKDVEMDLETSNITKNERNRPEFDVQDGEDFRGMDPLVVEKVINSISPEGKVR